MQQAKLDRIYNDQTAVAQNVLECVPTLETISKQQVVVAYKQTGRSMPQNQIIGCLHALKKAGLIKEPKTGHFIRVTASAPALKPVPRAAEPEIEMHDEEAIDDTPETETPDYPRDPLEVIDSLRRMFESAALEIEAFYTQEQAKLDKKYKQIKHFKALMDSLDEDN